MPFSTFILQESAINNLYRKNFIDDQNSGSQKINITLESEFKKLVEGRTILYLGAKDDMESRNLNIRLLNAEKQMSYYV